MISISKTIYIEPSYEVLNRDNLFNPAAFQDPSMALPYTRLRDNLAARGIAVHTADYFNNGEYLSDINEYWSFGALNKFVTTKRDNLNVVGFFLLEPPLIYPKIYKDIKFFQKYFSKIYLYNSDAIDGGCKFRQALIPIPYDYVLDEYWNNDVRSSKLVLVAGNHAPFLKSNELYSKRIDAIKFFSQNNLIDLYGRGWNIHANRRIFWWKYFTNYIAIKRSYKGPIANKHEVISKYKFSICFENSIIPGYITEKIFDCFYSGTVPIYYGAPDVEKYIEPNAYVDFRKFKDFKELDSYLKNISNIEYEKIKNSGKEFISRGASHFYNSLDNAVSNFDDHQL
jgi:hypothetical protein